MKLTVLYAETGRGWGKKIADHLLEASPASWFVRIEVAPPALPVLIDEPGDFLPGEVERTDLLLALAEGPGLAQLVPGYARLSEAAEVIVPVDDGERFPLGLQNQVRERLEGDGRQAVCPSPFCSLTEDSTNGDAIAEFGRHFGKPRFSAAVTKDGLIETLTVERGSPCGNADYVAGKLGDNQVEEVEERGPLLHHYYPCLASVDIIHHSAHITRAALRGAVRRCYSEMKEGRT